MRLPSARRVATWAMLVVLMLPLMAASPAGQVVAAESVPLPFGGGQSVRIIQGYDGGTHQGRGQFGLDLVLADGGTSGAEVVSPIDGTVTFAQAPKAGNGCIAIAMRGGGHTVMMCHVILSRGFGRGEAVARGQVLGTVGPAGTVGNNGVPHVHLELHRGTSVSQGVPFAPPSGLLLEGVALDASNTTAVTSKRAPLVSSNKPSPAAAGAVVAQREEKPTPLSAASLPSSVRTVQASSTTVASAAARIATVQGTDSCLKVRKQPSASGEVVGCLKEGTEISLKPLAANADPQWRQTDQGWISSVYLKRTQAVVGGTGGCLNVRESPKTSAGKVGCLPDGTSVTIAEGPRSVDGTVWYRIEKAGAASAGGWVVGQHLD